MDETTSLIKQWLGSGSINFFGPPFSGKDTQAERLAELLGGQVISGGDILRHGQTNPKVKQIMDSGGLIPSELFLKIIPPFLAQPSLKNKPLLLSSIGRLISEVPVVSQATHDSGHDIKAVILLQLPSQGVWRHFKVAQRRRDRGQRADDNPATLKVRLKEFKRTKPVLDYYHHQGLLITIDDRKDTDQVTQAILEALSRRARSSL